VHLDVRLNALKAEEMRALHQIIRQGRTLTTLGMSVTPLQTEAGTNIRSLDLHAYNGFVYGDTLSDCYKNTDRLTLSGYIDGTARCGLLLAVQGARSATVNRFTYLGLVAYISEEPFTNFFIAITESTESILSCMLFERDRRNPLDALREIPSIHSINIPPSTFKVSKLTGLEPGSGNYTYPKSLTLKDSMATSDFQYVVFR